MALRFHREWLWPWGVAIVAALALVWTLGGGLGWLFGALALASGFAVALRIPVRDA